MVVRKLTIKFFLLFFTFYILHFTFYISPAFAQGDGIGEARINPASPLYFLKSVREVLELKFAGTTRIRAIREFEFATRRIREVKSLANTNRQDLIEPTLYQYLFHLEEFLGKANLKDPDFATEVTQNIVSQMNFLQAVYGRVLNDTSLVLLRNKRALMSIRATVNSLSKLDLKLIERLKLAEEPLLAEQISVSRLSACKFLEKEASSSALNEVEKAVFSERAQKCLNTSQ